jgi:hypothetical protein
MHAKEERMTPLQTPHECGIFVDMLMVGTGIMQHRHDLVKPRVPRPDRPLVLR